jgi:hypothetical protein
LIVNAAFTVVAAVKVVVHAPVPLHPPPDQPVNVEPVVADAVRVTTVPYGYVAEQVPPQLMPPSLEATEPVPVPDLVTVSVSGCSVNCAITVVAAVIVTEHGPVPLHPPPDQPANVEPVPADAVSVTMVPYA